MRIEASHVDDDGHYLPVAPQEVVEIEHLFLSRCVLQGVEVRRPESGALDVSMKIGAIEVRWSGLYHPDLVPVGVAISVGDRAKFRVKNIGSSTVLARLDLHIERSL